MFSSCNKIQFAILLLHDSKLKHCIKDRIREKSNAQCRRVKTSRLKEFKEVYMMLKRWVICAMTWIKQEYAV